jgi:hypothetical protein
MTKPVTISKPKHIGGYTVFVLKVNDGRKYPYSGIILKGTWGKYEDVNDISRHVKELYQFPTTQRLMIKAREIIALRMKGSWGKYPPGRAVFGDR